MPPDCQNLLRGMIEVDPQKRLTVSVNSALLLQNNWVKFLQKLINAILGNGNKQIEIVININAVFCQLYCNVTKRLLIAYLLNFLRDYSLLICLIFIQIAK